MILRDHAIEREMRDIIASSGDMSAERALAIVVEKFAQTVSKVHDEHLRHRAADVRDVGMRTLSILLNEDQKDLIAREEHVIAVARQVIPSRLVSLLKQKIDGVVTDRGSRTSHAAILCRSYGVAAVSGVRNILDKIVMGDVIALDGTTGEVWINPDKTVLQELDHRRKGAQRSLGQTSRQSEQARPDQRRRADYRQGQHPQRPRRPSGRRRRAEGVGLFRTEFLYLNVAQPPTEDMQLAAYRSVIEEIRPNPVTIRTFDLGGDKMPNSFGVPTEDNPFLGQRSIRLALERPDLFKVQLRAILRAATAGPVNIMFPLVTTIDELRRARAFIEETKVELKNEELPYADDAKIGLMIEVPAAATMIKTIMKEADFASIGSNDLIQYIMAADRTNPQVVELYDSLAPAVLHTIKHVVDKCRELGKPIAVCGEMASRPLTVIVPAGMGVTELSVGQTFVPVVKGLVRDIDIGEARKLTERALEMDSGRDIETMLDAELQRIAPWAEEVA